MITTNYTAGFEYTPVVRCRHTGKVVKQFPRQKNLIIPAGVTVDWWSIIRIGLHAGTGTTPNSVLLNGTFKQTGTLIERVSGTGVFSSGDVGKYYKFDDGSFGVISSYTNTLTVVADRSATITARALTVYNTNRVNLDTWAKFTSTSGGGSGTGLANSPTIGQMRYWFTYAFDYETTTVTYTELGLGPGTTSSSQIASRVILDSAVSVEADQFLEVRVDLVLHLSNFIASEAVSIAYDGFPHRYNITSIVANGTYWEITLADTDTGSGGDGLGHHYSVGNHLNIADTLPVHSNIAAIVDNGATFTVQTTAPHGKTSGDSIVIAGSAPGGYNATFTVASTPDTTHLTVTANLGLGAGTGGTLRLATPGTWFNGTNYVISAVPTINKVRITSAVTPPAAEFGTVYGNGAAVARIAGNPFQMQGGFSQQEIADAPGDNSVSGGVIGIVRSGAMLTPVPGAIPGYAGNYNAPGTYDPTSRTRTFAGQIPSANENNFDIRQIVLTRHIGNIQQSALVITFAENQRKADGFRWSFAWAVSWEPELL